MIKQYSYIMNHEYDISRIMNMIYIMNHEYWVTYFVSS